MWFILPPEAITLFTQVFSLYWSYFEILMFPMIFIIWVRAYEFALDRDYNHIDPKYLSNQSSIIS